MHAGKLDHRVEHAHYGHHAAWQGRRGGGTGRAATASTAAPRAGARAQGLAGAWEAPRRVEEGRRALWRGLASHLFFACFWRVRVGAGGRGVGLGHRSWGLFCCSYDAF